MYPYCFARITQRGTEEVPFDEVPKEVVESAEKILDRFTRTCPPEDGIVKIYRAFRPEDGQLIGQGWSLVLDTANAWSVSASLA